VIIRKATTDVFSNPEAARVVAKFTEAYVYGVALDYCVKYACIGARRLGLSVYVIRDAVRAISAEGEKNAIATLRRRGVRFLTVKGLKRRLAVWTRG